MRSESAKPPGYICLIRRASALRLLWGQLVLPPILPPRSALTAQSSTSTVAMRSPRTNNDLPRQMTSGWFVLVAALLVSLSTGLPCWSQTAAERTSDKSPTQSNESQQPDSDDDNATEEATQLSESGLLHPTGPDTTIWIDDKGTPRPVVGMSYEDLTRAWRLLKGLDKPSNSPQFVRDRFQANGSVEADHAKLTITIDVTLLSGGLIEIPIGLANAILESRPEITRVNAKPGAAKSAQEELITYDSKRGGFVAWLSGEVGEERRIVMSLLVPLSREAAQTLMRLNIPRATESLMAIETAGQVSNVFASEGVLLDVEPNDLGGTRIRARGTIGDVQIGWQTPTPRTAKQQSVLSVAGQILTDIDGRSVRSIADLQVSSFGGLLESFRVRLPAGSTLIPGNPVPGSIKGSGANSSIATPRISLLSEGSTGNLARPDLKQPVCLVKLPEKTAGPVSVRIVTEQSLLPDDPLVDLAGFQVLGAVRQYGEMAIRVADDWRLQWGETSNGARRIAVSSLPETLQQTGVTDAVRYYRQPWHLPVRVMLLGSRVEVTPRYRLEIRPEEAILTATMNYRVPGARAAGFSIDLKDWTQLTADPIGPVGLVDAGQITQTKEGILYVPFKEPVSRRAAVSFTARRDLNDKNELLRFRLPVPQASLQETSEVTIVADSALQLIPDATRSRHLRSVPLEPSERDPLDPTGLHTFRFQGFLPDQVFVANKRRRPRRVDLDVETQISLIDAKAVVQQEFSFNIQNQAIDQLQFVAPEKLLREEKVRFELLPALVDVKATSRLEKSEPSSSESLPPGNSTATSVVSDEAAPAGLALRLRQIESGDSNATANRLNETAAEALDAEPFVVDLPRPWLGRFRLRATYRQEMQRQVEEGSENIDFDLVQPIGVEIGSHVASIRTKGDLPLRLVKTDSSWSVDKRVADSQGELILTSSESPNRLTLAYSPEAREVSEVVLKRAWRQTWIGESRTQQRSVFVLQTAAPIVDFRLPESVEIDVVEVVVNGELVSASRVDEKLSFELPDQSLAQQVIEIRYFQPGLPPEEAIAWQPVRPIADDSWSLNYWEVILPAARHAASRPAGMFEAMRWQPVTGLWRRTPDLTTGELANWTGASEPGLSTTAEHRYLYSWYAKTPADDSTAISTISRRDAVLGSSALMLTLGLLLIYSPALRQPWCMLLLLLAGTVIGLIYPGPFIVIAQAGFLGLLLVGFAVILKLLLEQPSAVTIGSSDSSPILVTDVGGEFGGQYGGETLITLPMGSVSTNAPTVSVTAGNSDE